MRPLYNAAALKATDAADVVGSDTDRGSDSSGSDNGKDVDSEGGEDDVATHSDDEPDVEGVDELEAAILDDSADASGEEAEDEARTGGAGGPEEGGVEAEAEASDSEAEGSASGSGEEADAAEDRPAKRRKAGPVSSDRCGSPSCCCKCWSKVVVALMHGNRGTLAMFPNVRCEVHDISGLCLTTACPLACFPAQ